MFCQKHAIKKYVVCPGHVTSAKDGQRHFISARALAELYGVPMNECVTYDYDQACKSPAYEHTNEWKLALIQLHPKRDGDYKLPKEVAPMPKKIMWPFPLVVGNIP